VEVAGSWRVKTRKLFHLREEAVWMRRVLVLAGIIALAVVLSVAAAGCKKSGSGGGGGYMGGPHSQVTSSA
jgi:hypothetical protein